MSVSRRSLALITAAVVVGCGVAAAAVAIVGGVGGSRSPISHLLGQAGIDVGSRDCVDSTGENSTEGEVLHTAMTTRYVKYHDGAIYSVEELSQRLGEERSPFFFVSDEAFADMGVEVFGPEVPAGGDAAFAQAVCDRPEMWAPEYLSSSQVEGLAQTPHFLRSLGRMVCQSVREADSFEAYLDPRTDGLAKVKADPVGTKQEGIAEAERALAEQEAQLANPDEYDVLDDDQERQFVEAIEQQIYISKEQLATVRDTPPEALIERAESQIEFQEIAVEHLCPETSQVGFGPECGAIMYPNSGGAEGIVRLWREGDLSCEDARAVLNNHFATVMNTDSLGRLPADSPLRSIMCETTSTSELADERFTLTSCASGGTDHAEVVIVPIQE